MILRLFLPLILAFCLPVMGLTDPSCGEAIACELGGRTYHVKVPDGWDGTTPLPVLLHFHGWMRTGALPVKHQRISGATRRRGVLLLAPNGRGRSWNFRDSATDDVAFAAAVIEDAATRFPIDRSRVYVSGYSYGAAMAWRYVCQNGDEVAALLAVSGSIRQSEVCDQGPWAVRHVHGLRDTVMDFPMGPGGDKTFPVSLWREKYKCGAGRLMEDWGVVDFLTFKRTVWNDCKGGRTVTLDLHSGGHFIPHGWIGWQLDQLMGQTPVYP